MVCFFFFYSHYCQCHQFERKRTRKLVKRYWICWVSQQLRNDHWQRDFDHKEVRKIANDIKLIFK
jgi:hypothetical protein